MSDGIYEMFWKHSEATIIVNIPTITSNWKKYM